MTEDDLHEQLEKLDGQIVHLLAERQEFHRNLSMEDAGEFDSEETVSFWVEEGVDRGLDEAALEPVVRGVIKLTQPRGE